MCICVCKNKACGKLCVARRRLYVPCLCMSKVYALGMTCSFTLVMIRPALDYCIFKALSDYSHERPDLLLGRQAYILAARMHVPTHLIMTFASVHFFAHIMPHVNQPRAFHQHYCTFKPFKFEAQILVFPPSIRCNQLIFAYLCFWCSSCSWHSISRNIRRACIICSYSCCSQLLCTTWLNDLDSPVISLF